MLYCIVTVVMATHFTFDFKIEAQTVINHKVKGLSIRGQGHNEDITNIVGY